MAHVLTCCSRLLSPSSVPAFCPAFCPRLLSSSFPSILLYIYIYCRPLSTSALYPCSQNVQFLGVLVSLVPSRFVFSSLSSFLFLYDPEMAATSFQELSSCISIEAVSDLLLRPIIVCAARCLEMAGFSTPSSIWSCGEVGSLSFKLQASMQNPSRPNRTRGQQSQPFGAVGGGARGGLPFWVMPCRFV